MEPRARTFMGDTTGRLSESSRASLTVEPHDTLLNGSEYHSILATFPDAIIRRMDWSPD
jgi:hypothetical protein